MTIMTYESFRQLVIRNIKNYLPDKYEKWEIRESVVKKINENLDCINLIPKDEMMQEGIFPNIYLNFFYKKLTEGFSFEYIMQAIAVLIDGATPPIEIQNFTDMVNEIIPTVINRDKNENLLKTLPHKEFLDLAVIFRIAVATEEAGVYGCNVTYDMMKEFDLDENKLFEISMINMQKKFPLKISNLGQQMQNIMKEQGIDESRTDVWSPMFMITNDEHFFGATGILYRDLFEKISEVLNDDLYIIPSSIHEILVISVGFADSEKLKKTIKDVNTASVDGNEWLSDNLYIYDKQRHTIEISVQN